GYGAVVIVMAALLRKGLVLQMKRGNPSALEGARRGLGVKRVAITGIRIGNDWHADDIGHSREAVGDGAHRQEPEIRNAGRARNRPPPSIHPRKPAFLPPPSRHS